MSTPFLGQCKMAAPTGGSPSAGAEGGTDYAPYYVAANFTPTSNLLTCGPYLKDNFSSQEPGSFSVPLSLTFEGLTPALIMALTSVHKNRTKYEMVYMANAATLAALGSPTADYMQVTVQFFFNIAPEIPNTVDEKQQFTPAVNCTYYKLDPGGGGEEEYGTAEPA